MRKLLQWMGRRAGEKIWFPARVPGNIQCDYGSFKNFGDIHFSRNVEAYRKLEDDVWFYRAEFKAIPREGQRLFFVAEGIDYQCEIRINTIPVCEHEGMFSKIELDLTEYLTGANNQLEIKILPHPDGGQPRGTGREEAAQCCKPAVSYGWDWHPRLLSSGLWQEAWLEMRDAGTIRDCSFCYQLNETRDTAEVSFTIDSDEIARIRIYDRKGKCVYQGTDTRFVLKDIRLWWCNGQGEPYLYRYEVSTKTDRKSGYIGFRTVQLLMNGESWENPRMFPKTRSAPPMTVCLNGRRIFVKGSNWLRPELFPGTVTKESYEAPLQLVKDAHMNLLRDMYPLYWTKQ